MSTLRISGVVFGSICVAIGFVMWLAAPNAGEVAHFFLYIYRGVALFGFGAGLWVYVDAFTTYRPRHSAPTTDKEYEK